MVNGEWCKIAVAFSYPVIVSFGLQQQQTTTINQKPFKAVQRKDFLSMFLSFCEIKAGNKKKA
jgi:hypothetical protein